MCNRKGLLVCLAVVCLGVSAALACGPFFPWQLLDDRAATLKATPANSFAFEVKLLASPPSDSLRAIEGQAPTPTDPRNEAVIKGAKALWFYDEGAAAFHAKDEQRAIPLFQSVLDLSEEEQRIRASWAAYMIGRCYGRLGDVEKASEAFRRTRELAVAGTPDPLGLAVASYGEEAKLHFDRAKMIVSVSEPSAEQITEYAREMTAAVALYAEQAARGSASGVLSLRFVAKHLLYKTPERLAAMVADSIVQRLLVAYVLAHDSEDSFRMSAPYDELPKSDVSSNPLFVTLVEAIEQSGLSHVTGADRLAALAYRTGRYDLAERLAATAPGPLSAWVKAKLALQKGDLATAATFYAEAVKAFPSSDEANPLERPTVELLAGERGVLMLARGEYIEALAQLYPIAAKSWGDVAYLAERVLTVDELQHFVDTKVPPPKIVSTEQKTGENIMPSRDEYFWLSQPQPATQLRDLLARRLVRAGRYQEALTYFPTSNATDVTDPYVRTHVAAYAQALQEAEDGWWPVERAQAWQKAAVLARKFGMEMMGTEAAPDFSAHGGYFDFGIGQTPSAGPFITDDELRRFATSTPNPNVRFHYRYLAVEHSIHAADLLPPRSLTGFCRSALSGNWMDAEQR